MSDGDDKLLTFQVHIKAAIPGTRSPINALRF